MFLYFFLPGCRALPILYLLLFHVHLSGSQSEDEKVECFHCGTGKSDEVPDCEKGQEEDNCQHVGERLTQEFGLAKLSGVSDLNAVLNSLPIPGIKHVTGLTEGLLNKVSLDGLTQIKNKTASLGNSFGGAVQGAVGTMTGAMGAVGGKVGEMMIGGVGAMTGAVQGMPGKVGEVMSGGVGAMTGAVQGMPGKVGEVMSGGVGAMSGAVSGGVGAMTGAVSGGVGAMKDIGGKFVPDVGKMPGADSMKKFSGMFGGRRRRRRNAVLGGMGALAGVAGGGLGAIPGAGALGALPGVGALAGGGGGLDPLDGGDGTPGNVFSDFLCYKNVTDGVVQKGCVPKLDNMKEGCEGSDKNILCYCAGSMCNDGTKLKYAKSLYFGMSIIAWIILKHFLI